MSGQAAQGRVRRLPRRQAAFRGCLAGSCGPDCPALPCNPFHHTLPHSFAPATVAEERKRRMEFEIVREDLPSMTVIESPAAAAQAAKEAEDPFLP